MSEPYFNIVRIYLLDMSIEVPDGAATFLGGEDVSPQVEIQIQHKSRHVHESLYEVVVTADVKTHTAKRSLFVIEVQQAGLFELRNIPNKDAEHLLNVTCPEILFPFLREAVSNATQRASFPPMILSPINFEALYQQSHDKENMLHEGTAVN